MDKKYSGGYHLRYDRFKKQEVKSYFTEFSTTSYRLFGGKRLVDEYRSSDKYVRTVSYDDRGRLSNILGFILFLCILITVYRILVGSNQVFSFTSFLYLLRDVPTLSLDGLTRFATIAVPNVPIVGDLIQFFRDIIALVGYLFVGLAQLATYVFYFLRFLVG